MENFSVSIILMLTSFFYKIIKDYLSYHDKKTFEFLLK